MFFISEKTFEMGVHISKELDDYKPPSDKCVLILKKKIVHYLNNATLVCLQNLMMGGGGGGGVRNLSISSPAPASPRPVRIR